MKQYIALDDVNRPQAEVVTDVGICEMFFKKALAKYYNCEGFLEDCLIEVLDEMR